MTKNKSTTVTEEIVIVDEPAAALVQVSDGFNFDEFAGDEDRRTAEDILPTIERYRLVQGMTKGQREHGLRPGMIYATASKRGFDKLLLVAIKEQRVVVERQIDKSGPNGAGGPNDGKFVSELTVEDAKVKAALVKNKGSFIKLQSVDGKTSLNETRNIHVAFLDPEDGVTCTGFGVLQCESTNIRPALVWRDDRVKGSIEVGGAKKELATLPTYAFRTLVDGQGVHPKNESALYRFNPYLTDEQGRPSWKASLLLPNHADELALLRKLKEHKALLDSGKLEIASYDSEVVDTEEAAEAAAF